MGQGGHRRSHGECRRKMYGAPHSTAGLGQDHHPSRHGRASESAVRMTRSDSGFVSEFRDQRTQASLGNEGDRLPTTDPLGSTLMLFRPFLALASDQERKDGDFAGCGPAAGRSRLLVRVCSDSSSADIAADPSLFVGLLSGRIRWSEAIYWPALGNNPTFRLSRGDQQQLDRARLGQAIRQGTILDMRRAFRPRNSTGGDRTPSTCL